MNSFHYSLIRYVTDPERMEPVNFGVILQGLGTTDFKLNPNFARRRDVDTQTYQRWRAFLTEEIRGEPMPLFQPPKQSVEFLHHLIGLCDRTVLISRPLFLSATEEESFDQLLDNLFTRLVLPPESVKHGQLVRPTSCFRDMEEEKQFRKRGMKKHPYLTLNGNRRWNAYRQCLNGENIVIDKVEVRNEVGLTADEIQKLASGVKPFLDDFLNTASSDQSRYYLLADDLVERFTDQTDEDFEAMRNELDSVITQVESAGGIVLRKANDVLGLAEQIDSKLPPIASSSRT